MTATPQQIPVFDGVELSVTGMTCSGCVNAVTRVLSRVAGVTSVEVDLDTGRARATGTARPESLIVAVEKAGYAAHLAPDEKTEENSHGRSTHCCG